ncbi:MAG: hypothetical protein M5U09_14685 [Gammaproteobacteria bacterium]|nr:hypothetical protein [Gammaproteobacteria bacterium]
MAMGGMVVMNEVRGEVEAYIESTEVAAGGDVDVEAVEDASIRAIAKSTVSSSGGSAFGEGNSVARNGQIVTNLVLSSADAFVNDSTIVSTAPDVLFSDTDTDPTTVNPRDTVHIDDASLFDDGDGVEGRTYRFLGGVSEAIVPVDEDFTDTTRWQLLEQYDRDVLGHRDQRRAARRHAAKLHPDRRHRPCAEPRVQQRRLGAAEHPVQRHRRHPRRSADFRGVQWRAAGSRSCLHQRLHGGCRRRCFGGCVQQRPTQRHHQQRRRVQRLGVEGRQRQGLRWRAVEQQGQRRGRGPDRRRLDDHRRWRRQRQCRGQHRHLRQHQGGVLVHHHQRRRRLGHPGRR